MTRDEYVRQAADRLAELRRPTVASDIDIPDEVVEAYDAGEALGMVSNRGLRNWPLRAAAIRAGLAAVVPLIRAQVLREYADSHHYVDRDRLPMVTFGGKQTPYCACGAPWFDNGCTQRQRLLIDATMQRLDGTTASAVALLTGMARDEIDQVGGVTPKCREARAELDGGGDE